MMTVKKMMIKNSAMIVLFGLLPVFLMGCNQETPSTSVAAYPDQGSKNFKQFARQCSACHRPPMPDLHTALAWEGVVSLMQQHRVQQGLGAMKADEKQQVLDYLRRHSGQEEGS